MGYDVHITRKEDWFDETGAIISLEEWLKYLSSDSEMRHDGFAQTSTPNGEIIRIENPGIAVWTGYSKHDLNGNMAWFCHFRDRVSVKNPDKEILMKMHSIACALAARVQGDEGEEYDCTGEPIAGKSATPCQSAGTRKPWWRFWSHD